MNNKRITAISQEVLTKHFDKIFNTYTTYDKAFSLIGLEYSNTPYGQKIVKILELEGYTEKRICRAIINNVHKIVDKKGSGEFWNNFMCCVREQQSNKKPIPYGNI